MSEPMSAERLAAIRRRSAMEDVVHDGRRFLAAVHLDRRALIAEVERRDRLAQVQGEMISAITAACRAAETERDQYRKQVELLGKHLQGGAQGLIDALVEADRLRAELDSIRARALARNDQLLAARDRCSYDDRARRRAYEQAAAELRSLVDGVVGE